MDMQRICFVFFLFLLSPPTLGYGHTKSDFGSVPYNDLVRLKYNTGYRCKPESCTSEWSKDSEDAL